MGIGEALKTLFGESEDKTLNSILEISSIFTNAFDKFTLTGRLAVDLHFDKMFPAASEVELLSTINKINPAVNHILDRGYKIQSVVHGDEFYKVNLGKERYNITIYAFSALPNTIKDSEKKMIKYNDTAYDILLASPEDIFLVGLLYDKTYHTLMNEINKEKLFKKYNNFSEDLKDRMDKNFNLNQ